jgi:hypothetical protein
MPQALGQPLAVLPFFPVYNTVGGSNQQRGKEGDKRGKLIYTEWSLAHSLILQVKLLYGWVGHKLDIHSGEQIIKEIPFNIGFFTFPPLSV